jgi:hypothetical protein
VLLVANAVYVREKERCKELLDISKAKLDEVDEDLRNEFKAMEEVCRNRSYVACLLSFARDLQSGTAHERTADQLKDELGTLRARLELLLTTNEGVIEQYERRKEEVCCSILMFNRPVRSIPGRAQIESLGKKIAERARAAAKVEKSMKVARVGFH